MKKIFKKIVVAILTAEAKLVLKKYKPKIIAVTGSVGKTSTKDAIYTVLSEATYVRKSQKSFNSEIGIPLTILGCPNGWDDPFIWLRNFLHGLSLLVLPNPYPIILILEVGADRPGDIEKITRWIRPDVAVITKLSDVPVHVEFFASPEEVKEEKAFLAKALKPDGTLVLNADDKDVMAFGEVVEEELAQSALAPSVQIFSYGFDTSATVRASNYKVVYKKQKGVDFPTGISYKVVWGTSSAPVALNGSVGVQNVYTTLAAIAVGLSEGFDLALIVETIKNHEAPPGRMKIIEGINDSVIIDDSYNSSPIALNGALETLRDLKVGEGGGANASASAGASGFSAAPVPKKIAILGDMLELGSFSSAEHKLAGEKVAKVCSVLITVGLRAKAMRDAAIASGMSESAAVSFEDSEKAGEYARSILSAGDIILVKGSQGNLRMEKATAAIMAHPEEKERLLVRQENEWQKR